MYTADLVPNPHLVAKMKHATISNGLVKSIDISKAQAIDGVVGVYTCFDVPDIQFCTAGHPWSTDPHHQDIQDRKLLNQRVRMYGDVVAAVVAENTVAADRAIRAIEVEYEEYEPRLTTEQALNPEKDSDILHTERPNNIIVHSDARSNMDKVEGYNTIEEIFADPQYHHGKFFMKTPRQQQVHIELCLSYCYKEGNRIVCVSSTQIPHICRRIIGQALGIPWGHVRVIKPYIGGGFGNKQDVLFEPLNAWLCEQVGGRCVMLELTREEVFYATRSRQPKEFNVEASWDDDMNLKARYVQAFSNQGGYASHGHALVANSVNSFRQLYDGKELASRSEATTFYSNQICAGAMRAYGVPEGNWAAEVLMSDIAYDMGWDGVEFRLNNAMPLGYVDEFWPGKLACWSNGMRECAEEGARRIGWAEKREAYKNQTGPIRKGIGVAFFVYKTAVADLSLETAAARMVLTQDGSVMMELGATEIGQGADTVFSQMAAEVIGVPTEMVHIKSTQDTDTSPYDSGAYASRQTYVSGTAVRKVGLQLHQAIIDYAHELFPDEEVLDVKDAFIVDKNDKRLMSLEELSTTAYYSFTHAKQIYAEDNAQVHDNTFAMGCCFVDLEVDIPLAKVKINKIVEMHDSGRIMNPKTAEQQVHGGMAQSIGMALSEELLTDMRNGRILNANLLDYKIPTMLDLPDLECGFVETNDPTGPYGNKALGECPCIPAAAAVRDAILNATGVKLYEAPMTPQRIFEGCKEAGLV
jgi:xanthine dehydrogenase molybdenum-binding subunit